MRTHHDRHVQHEYADVTRVRSKERCRLTRIDFVHDKFVSISLGQHDTRVEEKGEVIL